jgi:nucleoside-diphosphate-sugar epimerase
MWRVFITDGDLRRRLLSSREGAVLHRAVDRFVPSLVRKAHASPGPGSTGDGALPIAVARPWVLRNTARKARVRIDKARRLLGYEPAFNLAQGMGLTEQWARYAGLLS